MKFNFEWDELKDNLNVKKHKIRFAEAKSVFDDENSLTINDPDHSLAEERYIDIGLSDKGRLLVVVYTERKASIRIISARKATLTEKKIYEQNQ